VARFRRRQRRYVIKIDPTQYNDGLADSLEDSEDEEYDYDEDEEAILLCDELEEGYYYDEEIEPVYERNTEDPTIYRLHERKNRGGKKND